MVTGSKHPKHDLTLSAVPKKFIMLAQVLWVCIPVIQGVPGPRGQAPGGHQEQGQIHACWQGGQCSRVRPPLSTHTALFSISQLELLTAATYARLLLCCCYRSPFTLVSHADLAAASRYLQAVSACQFQSL